MKLKLIYFLFLFFSGNILSATFISEQRPNKTIIKLSGTIEKGDLKIFNTLLSKSASENIYLVLSSGGGDLFEAFKIAKKIVALKNKGVQVDTSSLYCQSACFFIAAAGQTKRVLYSKNVFGVHFPFYSNGQPISNKKKRYIFNMQVESLVHSGFSKKDALSIIKKALKGRQKTTVTFSREELIDLGFILL